ncbi:MAG: hypothetical protein ABWY55_07280 [Microbacterium sp.]
MILDEQAGARAGEPLESLAFVRERQGFSAEGPVVPLDALDTLAAADRRGRLPRYRRGAAMVAALVAARLVDERDALTPEGLLVRSHWAGAAPLLEVRRRGVPGVLSAWRGDSTVLIAASAPAGADPFAADDVQLGIISLDAVVPAIAAWIGIAPAWTFSDGPLRLPAATYEERLTDAATPIPADAGPHLRRAWGERWVEYVSSSDQRSLRLVTAGDAGLLGVVVEGATATIDSLPSAAAFSSLLEQYSDALEFAAG